MHSLIRRFVDTAALPFSDSTVQQVSDSTVLRFFGSAVRRFRSSVARQLNGSAIPQPADPAPRSVRRGRPAHEQQRGSRGEQRDRDARADH
ncbi:hypothetical protein ACX84Z_17510, partial [Burkholderia pseudomallei]